METQRVIIIGGGSVAARKATSLVDAGACPLVISPDLHPDLEDLLARDEIRYLARGYQPGDLAGAFLVISATDDPGVNQQVWEAARTAGCLVNIVDDPSRCNFILPAVVRRGDLSLSISTGGGSPALARRLRERLDAEFGPEYGDLAAILDELRPQLIASCPPDTRLAAALSLVDGPLLEILRRDGYAAAREYAASQINGSQGE
ncbi:MAG TPA: bifunctional precorrin-2 dehydrogenase/sirohydrochlorin ferrochelatase [Anaerolineales bacterium]|nr:bifunctional precorrin-2 dehydrogenase/sirohydrochlorin ferrochelatase [Anaerolineales bacterium]